METEDCLGVEGATCTVLIALCHALPPNLGSACDGASVCMMTDTAEGTEESYSLGHFEDYTLFRKSKCSVLV